MIRATITINAESGVMLSSDLSRPESIPYFLWNELMTVAEFREGLQTGSIAEQTRLLVKLLREARDTDVWQFISPAEVWQKWTTLVPQLGRHRNFWEFLLNHWHKEGLLGK